MKPSLLLTLALLLFSYVDSLAQPGKLELSRRAGGYDVIFDELMSLQPDPSKVAAVSDLLLQRDVGTFLLESGSLTLCRPVAGRTCAAVFVGKGTFSYTPSTQVEREQLARFYEKQSLQEPFTTLVLFFADSTAEELADAVELRAGTVPPEATSAVEQAIPYLGDRESNYFATEFMGAFLNGERSALFYAQIGREKEPLFFEINPDEPEEVMLLRPSHAALAKHQLEVVNQFHTQEEYRRGVDPTEDKSSVKIARYTVDCTIADNLGMSVAADLRIEPLRKDHRWVYFQFYPDLNVDSARWEEGAPASLARTGVGIFWVEMSPAARDTGATLRLHYHGKMLERIENWVVLKSSLLWYPHHGYLNKAYFDLTFHTPSLYKFASVGENVSTEENDDVTTSRWVTKKPIRNAGFNIGLFRENRVELDTLPPITLYMNSSTGREVGEDVAASIRLFEYMFGECPVDRLYATEIPQSHGEAFPGLIHFWSGTFQRTDRNGSDEIFRAHEVAHQWWAIGLDFRTYHDQWLSEGFAQYSGLLFMQAVRKDNDRFFYWLRKYRDDIVNNRKSIFGGGQESGPIWLGWRTSSSTTEGDYDLIIYMKGAWVLHMLRNLLIDPNTMNESKFREVMRDFYGSYVGKQATTEDFQRVVERHVGTKMDWFFRQWVYGTAIPKYTCSYTTTELPDGKYVMKCRVDQENVPDDFKAHMLVRIDFGDKGSTRGRRLITGPRTEFELILPMKPTEVVFNDLESVLCEIED